MRITPTHGVLKGPEGKCPPLPFLTVDDAEGEVLVKRKLAREYVDPAPIAASQEPPKKPVDKVAAPAVAKPSVGVAEAGAGKAADKAAPPAPNATSDDEAKLREIADHIALLSDDERDADGKPKLDALSAALGQPVTAEEVEAALKLGE